jgi:GH24 family phage-related lysozyme (muramidase)
MQLSDNGLRLIASFEGFVDHLYDDPAGHCTIGYGHLVHTGRCDGRTSESLYAGTVSQGYGLMVLRADVLRFEDCVNRLVIRTLNQNRFDALVSFAFNIGCSAFEASTLLRKLNNGEYHRVCDELMLWVHGGGNVLPGLVRRREAECELFNRPHNPPVIIPIIEEENDMAVLLFNKDNPHGTYWLSNLVHKRKVLDVQELNELRYIGTRSWGISARRLNAIRDA